MRLQVLHLSSGGREEPRFATPFVMILTTLSSLQSSPIMTLMYVHQHIHNMLTRRHLSVKVFTEQCTKEIGKTRDCVKHTFIKVPPYQIACESASMAPSQNIDVKLGELCLVPWSICLVRCQGRRLESPLGVTVSFTQQACLHPYTTSQLLQGDPANTAASDEDEDNHLNHFYHMQIILHFRILFLIFCEKIFSLCHPVGSVLEVSHCANLPFCCAQD